MKDASAKVYKHLGTCYSFIYAYPYFLKYGPRRSCCTIKVNGIQKSTWYYRRHTLATTLCNLLGKVEEQRHYLILLKLGTHEGKNVRFKGSEKECITSKSSTITRKELLWAPGPAPRILGVFVDGDWM